MKSTIVNTLDGSSTILSAQFGVHYHSLRGAIGEAMHVFIRFIEPDDHILEVGLGTGLNAMLALQTNLNLSYTAIELYPIDIQTARSLSFYNPQLEALHAAPWNVPTPITPTFTLTKLNVDIANFTPVEQYDKIFFDAFDPEVVPDQWVEPIFRTMRQCLRDNGKLLTYCSKGIVKQALRNAGFTVTRLPGALGKHHMLSCQ